MAGEFHDHSHRYKRIVSAFDHTVLEESGVVSTLADVRAVQRSLDELVARLGARADELAAQGRSAAAREVLRGDGAVSSRQAGREACRSRAAATFPAVTAAFHDGLTSGAHIDALIDLTTDLTEAQISALDDAALADSACSVPVETFRKSLRRRIDNAIGDHGLQDTVAKQEQTRLRLWRNERTGMGHLQGEFDPESFEMLNNAIEQRMSELCRRCDEPVTKDQRLAAEALIDLITGDGARSGRPSIIVVVDAKTMIEGPHPNSIRQTETGADLAPDTISRLACDATVRRVMLDDRNVPIDVGRSHRTATPAQWAAIKAIHTTCAWDGCRAQIDRCQLHHIFEWEHGGHTDLDNLTPLCSRHHHLVHEGQWSVKLLPDRTLEIFKPDGGHHATVQPPLRC